MTPAVIAGITAKRLMDANEVVIHRKQRDRLSVIFDLLREGIRQPSEAASVHTDIEVAALGIRGADVAWIGVAFDRLLARADALCGL